MCFFEADGNDQNRKEIMKSTIIIILSISISVAGMGQVLPPKILEQFDFSSIEHKVSDAEKLELLQKLVFTKYLLQTNFETPDSYDYDNYHVLDFNADGKLDIIYDGRNPMGIETNNVVFFLRKGDSLRPMIKLNGDFVNLELKNNLLQRFQLLKSPCCASFIYKIADFEFLNSGECFIPQNETRKKNNYSYGQVNDTGFCVSLVGQYAYVMKTEFPDSIEFNRSSFVIEKAFLTPKPMEPSSTDFNEGGYTFHFMNNKAISELSKGTKCVILSNKTDDRGNTYCFVKLIYMGKSNNYMKKIEFEQMGWINQKNLD